MEKPTILMFMCLLSCLGILAQTTVESRVSSTSDDAEETLSTGAVSLTSNDLDIRSSDLNAMRFQLNVPQGATIQDAWIEFKAKDTNSGANTFTFSCQDSDDAAAFGSGSGNLTARTKTSATVNWNVPDWTLDQTYNSVDFAAAVQEVVDRSGWNANNHIVVFVEASGANKRAAKTYDFNGNDSESPKLVVTYQTSGGGGGSTSEVQAESFSAESGTSVSSGNSGFTGTGYVDYGGNGTFAEWVVNLSGTTADFVFRYAVGVAGQNRVCDLLINGNPAGSVNFNSTGGWSTWGTSSINGVSINNGSNTIRLVANNSIGGPNLDKFDVTASGSGGGGDTQAPSVPTGLSSSSVTSTSAIINWNASTDNVGVTGYNVFVDGNSAGTASDTDRTITGLSPSTTYSITVSAFDAAGNTSALSSALSVTTTGGGGGGNVSNIYVEAESGAVEAPVQVLSDGNASGGQYVATTSGSSTAAPPASGKTSITVDLESGAYKIWGRVQASDGGSDSYWVRVDGGTAYKWNNIPQSSSYQWDDVHDADNSNIAVTWNLSAGSHTVEFLYRESNTRLDRVYITKNGDTPNDSGGGDPPNPVYTRTRYLGTNMSFFFYGTEGCGATLSNPWIFKADGLNLATETNPWEPLFLDDHKIFSVIRFMNWNGGNGDPKVTWDQRTLKGDPKQEGRNMAGGINDQDFSTQPDGRQTNGVAFEWEVDLCNRLQTDMWINVPAKTMDPADFPNGDDYNNEFVYKMAILMKHGVDMKNVNIKSLVGGKNNLDQLKNFDRQWFVDRGGEITGDPLDTNLKVYVEYANEVWCCGDGNYRPSAVWARSKSDDIGFQSNAHWLFAPWAEIRSWKAYEDVFGASRIVKVAGSASAWFTRIDEAFNNVYNVVSNNRNKWNIRPDKWKWANYTRAGGTPADAPNFRTEWTAGLIERAEGPRVNNVSWRALRDYMRDVYGLPLIGYEGGQSMADNNSLKANFFSTRNDADDMYDEWLQQVDRYFEFTCHYRSYGASCGDYERATWGAKSYPGQTNNIGKYNALKDWVDGVTPRLSPAREEGESQPVVGPSPLLVYPNPSERTMKIELGSLKEADVAIFNLQGKLVLKKKAIGDGLELNLPQGIYILNAQGEGKTFSTKLIFQ